MRANISSLVFFFQIFFSFSFFSSFLFFVDVFFNFLFVLVLVCLPFFCLFSFFVPLGTYFG